VNIREYVDRLTNGLMESRVISDNLSTFLDDLGESAPKEVIEKAVKRTALAVPVLKAEKAISAEKRNSLLKAFGIVLPNRVSRKDLDERCCTSHKHLKSGPITSDYRLNQLTVLMNRVITMCGDRNDGWSNPSSPVFDSAV